MLSALRIPWIDAPMRDSTWEFLLDAKYSPEQSALIAKIFFYKWSVFTGKVLEQNESILERLQTLIANDQLVIGTL